MDDVEIKDKNFSKSNIENYHLVVLPGGNFFYAAFYDRKGKKLIYFTKRNGSCKAFLKENKYANKIHLIIQSFYNVLVPYSFFDKDKVEELIKFAYTTLPDDVVISYDKLLFDSIVNIYGVPSRYNSITDTVSAFSLYCDTALSIYKSGNKKPFVFLVLQDEFFYLYFLDEGKLVFGNTFAYKSVDDVLYQVFNLIDKNIDDRKSLNFNIVTNKEEVFAAFLMKKFKEAGLKPAVLKDFSKDFLATGLMHVNQNDLLFFYLFFNIENNRR